MSSLQEQHSALATLIETIDLRLQAVESLLKKATETTSPPSATETSDKAK